MPPGPRVRGRSRRGRGLQGAVSGRHISGGAGRAPGPKASAQRRLRPHVSQSGFPHHSSPGARCFRTPPARVSAPGCSPGPQAPQPTAQDRPAPHRPPAARAAMGVEGCTKCIKYLLFVFNFVFWVSPGRRGGGAGAPRSPQAARSARPRRGVTAGPPSCGATCARWERGWGSWAGRPGQWGSSGAVATPDGGAGGCEPGLGACGRQGPGLRGRAGTFGGLRSVPVW